MKQFSDFTVYSGEFLERAERLLGKFDEREQPELLFYAALELRYGIESRLYEYIDANLNLLKVRDKERKKYIAKDLLKLLLQTNPNAGSPKQVIFRTADGTPMLSVSYEPVSASLVNMHGRLGGLLHTTYFRQNPNWYLRRPSAPAYRTLADERRFLQEVASELGRVVAGTMTATLDSANAMVRLLREGNRVALPDEPLDPPPAPGE